MSFTINNIINLLQAGVTFDLVIDDNREENIKHIFDLLGLYYDNIHEDLMIVLSFYSLINNLYSVSIDNYKGAGLIPLETYSLNEYVKVLNILKLNNIKLRDSNNYPRAFEIV